MCYKVISDFRKANWNSHKTSPDKLIILSDDFV